MKSLSAKVMSVTPTGRAVSAIKAHPYVAVGLLAAAGLLIWYFFLRPSSTTQTGGSLTPTQSVQPTLNGAPSQSSNPFTQPSLSVPQSSSPSTSTTAPAYTYQAPSLSSGGISSGINTGTISNTPTNYFYNLTRTISNVSNMNYSLNMATTTQNTTSNTLSNQTTNNNQVTQSQQINVNKTINASTSGPFSGLNLGSTSGFGFLGGSGVSGSQNGNIFGSGINGLISAASGFFSRPTSSSTPQPQPPNPARPTTTVSTSLPQPPNPARPTTTASTQASPFTIFGLNLGAYL